MAELIRTGVSIEQDLLEKFDKLIAKRGYENRTDALRDLIREMLVSEEVNGNKPVVATLSMVYDHHRPRTGEHTRSLIPVVQRESHLKRFGGVVNVCEFRRGCWR
jgi:metal-responsive CopG/Arc/MetJ family transcriptional regulator